LTNQIAFCHVTSLNGMKFQRSVNRSRKKFYRIGSWSVSDTELPFWFFVSPLISLRCVFARLIGALKVPDITQFLRERWQGHLKSWPVVALCQRHLYLIIMSLKRHWQELTRLTANWLWPLHWTTSLSTWRDLMERLIEAWLVSLTVLSGFYFGFRKIRFVSD